MEEDITILVQNFFEKMGIPLDSLEVTNTKEYAYNLKICSPDSGILIGQHGKHLDSLQSLLRLMINKDLNSKNKIHIEINDYNKTKDERLYEFIESKIEEAKSKQVDICLPFYDSYYRKKIHSFIAYKKDSTIKTKSMGEAKDRRLYICPQKRKLTIDIDGNDI